MEKQPLRTEKRTLSQKILSIGRAAFNPYERAARRSGSDPRAIRDLMSKDGLKLHYYHTPKVKGEILQVTYAEEDDLSD